MSTNSHQLFPQHACQRHDNDILPVCITQSLNLIKQILTKYNFLFYFPHDLEETRPRSLRSVWLCGDLWQVSSSKIRLHMCASLFEKKLTVTSNSNIKVFDMTDRGSFTAQTTK